MYEYMCFGSLPHRAGIGCAICAKGDTEIRSVVRVRADQGDQLVRQHLVGDRLRGSRHGLATQPECDARAITKVTPPGPMTEADHREAVTIAQVVHGKSVLGATLVPGVGQQEHMLAHEPVQR